jgi:hypothetical protein
MTIHTIGAACLFTMLQITAANANQSGHPVTVRTGVQVLTISSGVEPVMVDSDGVVSF